MRWNFNHFTGQSVLDLFLLFITEIIQGLDWDELAQANGVFRISSERHKGWSRWVDTENGNYDYLLGIDVRRGFSSKSSL